MNTTENIYKTKHEGKVYNTKNFGEVVILKYSDCNNVHVKFVKTGFEVNVSMSQLKTGSVKDRESATVYGVGIVGAERTQNSHGVLKEYDLWKSMLSRCYASKSLGRNPTYEDCTVSDNFKYFPYFKEWCNKQIGFGNVGWCLDKDILSKGSKVYSEDTCCFVPPDINMLLVKCTPTNGNKCVGIYWCSKSKMFKASLSYYGNAKVVGKYTTEIEAFYAYKQAKESYIKEVANKWKDQIDSRVYEALMNWGVKEHFDKEIINGNRFTR